MHNKLMAQVQDIKRDMGRLAQGAGGVRVAAMICERRSAVCEICGAIMEVDMNPEVRLEQVQSTGSYVHFHENGRQHKGHVRVRAKIAEIEAMEEKWQKDGIDKEDADRVKKAEEKPRKRSRDRGGHRSRSRDRRRSDRERGERGDRGDRGDRDRGDRGERGERGERDRRDRRDRKEHDTKDRHRERDRREDRHSDRDRGSWSYGRGRDW